MLLLEQKNLIKKSFQVDKKMGATINFILMALAANLVSGETGPRNNGNRFNRLYTLEYGNFSNEIVEGVVSSAEWLCDGKFQNTSVPCNGKCPQKHVMNCNSTCSDPYFAEDSDHWLCGNTCQPLTEPCEDKCATHLRLCKGKCVELIKPCKGKCLYTMILDCDEKCVHISKAKNHVSWNCHGACLSKNEPCDGICFLGYKYCDGKCISSRAPCKGKCSQDSFLSCNGTECFSIFNAKFHSKLDCNGKCQSMKEPCQGRCLKGFRHCNGRCIGDEEPCNGECVKGRYLDCSSKCIREEMAEIGDKWLCNGTCQSVSKSCNGVCLLHLFQCGNNCYDELKPCKTGGCPKGTIQDCSGSCTLRDLSDGKWLCGNVCQDLEVPCNRQCPPFPGSHDGWLCRDTNVCLSEKTLLKCRTVTRRLVQISSIFKDRDGIYRFVKLIF